MPRDTANRSERRSVNSSHLRYKKTEQVEDHTEEDEGLTLLHRDSSALFSMSMSIDLGTTEGIANFMQNNEALATRFKEKPRGIADIDRKSLGLDFQQRNSSMVRELKDLGNKRPG